MKRFIATAGAMALLAGLFIKVGAQAPAVDDDPTKTEPEAVNALKEMGTYLRGLKDFQVNSEGTQEIVLTDGQKVQLAQTTTLLARFPDRLMANIDGDQGPKVFLYNGKTFTVYAPDDGYYATVNAPATLAEVANALDENYDIQLPLADLFLWGRPGVTPPDLKSAIDIGPSTVDGVTCEHYAYRQDGLDWQVWIQKGSHPLPKKLVLTTTTDEARPQHAVILKWNLAPSYNDAVFNFEPPPGSQKVTFASSVPADAATNAAPTNNTKGTTKGKAK